MTTVHDLLLGTDLADVAARGILADALDEQGRSDEAGLLRGPDAVKLSGERVVLAASEDAPGVEMVSEGDNDGLTDAVRRACDLAAGRMPFDQSADGISIRGAYKDLNSKGRGPWWYRMVWRSGSWVYVSDERLPSGTYLASDRRATIHGDVFPGEIVGQHDKGGLIDAMWLIVEAPTAKEALVSVESRKRRDGNLCVTLPSGDEVTIPNPRKR